MKILGIETSCDETAASVVEDGRIILSNVVVSQIDIFAAYGGVIPELAARSHLEAILPVIDKALRDASCTWADIDAIAVTHAPGLLGSLLIGTLTARTLAILHNKPLYPVHHLKSHVYANWLEPENPGTLLYEPCPDGNPPANKEGSPDFPLLALVISGGHTQILYMAAPNNFKIIGTTHDDAVGECFDKIAKILGLPYPGGPSIATAAKKGNPAKYHFPHPKVANLDFSFSGLKTAVLRTAQEISGGNFRTPSHELAGKLTEEQKNDIAASFEDTATDILIEKLQAAKAEYPAATCAIIAGGASANALLREKLKNHEIKGQPLCPALGIPVYFPAKNLSGDNGAMVAAAADAEIKSGVQPANPYKVNILPRTPIV